MADMWTGIGDFLGLNKGKATSAAAVSNDQLLSDLAKKGGGYLDQANKNSQSLLDLSKSGANLYADSMGINGDAGNARAGDAFHTGAGYNFSVDQGTQALMRTAASRGEVGGGGLGVDLAKYVTGSADQAYGDWQHQLQSYDPMYASATAGANASLGDLAQFQEDLTSGHMANNNQGAAGAEAGQGALWGMLGNAAGVVGAGVGAAAGIKGLGQPAPRMPGFGGYGTY